MVERTLISISPQLQLIERLQHLIYLSSSLIFISAEDGAGKSTLFEQLANKLNTNIKQVHLRFNEQLSDEIIRQKIITQLYDNALFDAHDSLYVSIAQLQEKRAMPQALLISIDNAQYISAEILSELAYLCMHKASLGDVEINVMLSSHEENNQQGIEQLNKKYPVQEKGTFVEFKLAPLDIEDASRLLMHYFAQVNYSSRLENQDALTQQLKLCSGNPQKIIALAETIMAGADNVAPPSRFRARLPALLLMFLLLSVAVAIATYVYPQLLSYIKQTNVLIFEDDSNVSPEPMDTLPDTQAELLAGSWSEQEQSEVTDNLLLVGESSAKKQQLLLANKELHLVDVKNEEAKRAPLINDVKKKTLLTPTYTDVVLKVNANKPLDVSAPIKATLDINALKKSALIKKSIKSKTEAPKPKTETPKAEPLKTKKRVTVQQYNKFSPHLSSKKLLKIDADFYTLQLSAMSTQEAVEDFIRANFPQKDLYLYRTIRKGKPWYIAVYGQYPNYEAALESSHQLPGSLSKLDHWIKKYTSVHQDLQLNHD
ncbi:DamX-like protein [Psychromonas sp. CNPT3]|uniref:AAA family ATPase n=1 Tax=Psychromonas sp. CNPT3 TaxID=314282 RepID=UPI00006E507E|nr:AAA family ATPase [Psychromonas sp. CNPT3]AGH82475.1 DamX-like protein [Psychromonas sp. CNPT3]